MPDVVNGRGQAVRLGRELARGGEGAVFEVATDSNLVAKIYHRPPPTEKAEKLRVMASLRNEHVAKLAAWPIDILSKRSGELIGLLMPKISGRTDIHNLYGPKSRCQQFMRADWRFLIRVANNIARAFAVVHETGCVIGDVNHGGVLVAQDATVRLIDCDSFQVIAGGRKYLCEVGVENFTPPELQGTSSFSNVVRTQNHDSFGLAVMTFLLLFMGRHPFDGTYLGSKNLSLGERIQQFRFAYSIRPNMSGMKRPPGTPPLPIVGTELGVMFERAFSREGAQGQRATARDWAAALQRLEERLQPCRSNESHWHLRGLNACPWCTMEAATGVVLFPVIVTAQAGTAFNIDALLRDISAIPHPGATPGFVMPVAHPSREAVAVRHARGRRKVLAILAAVAAVVGGLLILPLPGAWVLVIFGAVAFFGTQAALDTSPKAVVFREKRDAASSRWEIAQNDWNSRSSPQAFDAKKAEVDALKWQWSEIPNVRLRKLDALKSDQRRIQLEHFLDGFEIEKATIPGVGAGRKQTLESYGIETAVDIQGRKLEGVPGFGPKLRDKLMDWRHSIERRFVFDARRAVDPKDTARVEQETIKEKQRISAALAKAVAELRHAHTQIMTARQHLRPQVEAAQREYAQAVADYTAAAGQ